MTTRWRSTLLLTGVAGLALAGPVRAQTYSYTAQLAAPATKQGLVEAAGIRWQCSGAACRTTGPWPVPGLEACHALAVKVGVVVSYGHPGAALDRAQLQQCNVGLAAAPVASAPAMVPMRPALTPAQAAALRPRLDPRQWQLRADQFARLVQQREHAAEVAHAAIAPARPTSAPNAPRLPSKLSFGVKPPARQIVVMSHGTDCDDLHAETHPGASEICDGMDNNCDGVVDEGQTLTFYRDADGDGHGDPNQRVAACPSDQQAAAASGNWLSLVGNDCDDSNPDVWHDCH